MEIVTRNGPSEGDLVEIAFAENREEAESIQGLLQGNGIPSLLRSVTPHGPSLGIGLLPRGPQQVMVHADQAAAARRLLDGILVEADPDATIAFAEAEFAGEGQGKKPRGYGLIGAYARAWLWPIGALAVAFAIFLLLRLV